MDKLLTVDDVAAMLQVSPRTAYRLMHQMAHLMRPLRVSEMSVRLWIADRTVDPEELTRPRIAAKKRRKGEGYRIPKRRTV